MSGRARVFPLLILAIATVAHSQVISQQPGVPAGAPRTATASGVPSPAWKLVYTRQPRATLPVPGTGYADAANWQHASDVGRINWGLAEADVVLDDLKGNIQVIHNCTTSPEVCVAQEARVSPDGKHIIYSVGVGTALVPVGNFNITEIESLVRADLWVYDIATQTRRKLPAPPGVIDRQPDWLSNDKIVFVSNRGHTFPFRSAGSQHQDPKRCFNGPYCVSQEYGYGPDGESMQLWTANIDGSNAKNISPHEQMALAPAVLPNGDILYSCWNAHGQKSFNSTPKNKWWLCRVDGNGADETALLNGHKSGTLRTREWLQNSVGGEGRSQLRAVRSVAMIFPGKLAITNYYRGNHLGSMGIVFGLDYGDPHIEGCSTDACLPYGDSSSTAPGSGHYTPRSLTAITPYGQDQDMDVRFEAGAPFRPLGKAGYPAPYNAHEFLITHGRGQCYEVTEPHQTQPAWLKGEPTCQKAIYRVKVPMVTNPFDTSQMEMIAGGNQWQAYDARAIANYQSLYGQAAPAIPAPLAGDTCFLQVVDARQAELSASRPYDWLQTLPAQCTDQGCAVNTEDPGFHAREMKALTILLPELWDYSYAGHQAEYIEHRNNMGHKSIATLGSQPLQADGSVKMQVPCETPFLMVGTDKNGLSIAHDEMLHSLRKGETRTCHGCHDGHSVERAAALHLSAAERFKRTQAAATSPAMPVKQPPLTWQAVQPIVASRCAGCHTKLQNPWAYSFIAWDTEQLDDAFGTAAGPAPRKLSARGDYILAAPYTSKYVAKFGRDSLLYWKCIGSRQDGRTNKQYNNDIDFGAAHISGATPAECGLMARWIDSGIQY